MSGGEALLRHAEQVGEHLTRIGYHPRGAARLLLFPELFGDLPLHKALPGATKLGNRQQRRSRWPPFDMNTLPGFMTAPCVDKAGMEVHNGK